MVISSKEGIITAVSTAKTKAGKPMLVITYSSGNQEKLLKLFVFEDDDIYSALYNERSNLVGQKIVNSLEIPE